MQPPKVRTPMDSDKRAGAVAKMRATRKARGTTSRKQKLAIKGDVTGVCITPVSHAEAAAHTPSSRLKELRTGGVASTRAGGVGPINVLSPHASSPGSDVRNMSASLMS